MLAVSGPVHAMPVFLSLSGDHPELKQKCLVFEKVKQLRLHAAQKYRELQSKNIENLFKYEVQQADNFYEVCVPVYC